MTLLKSKKSRWITGTILLIALIIGTLMATPTGGKKLHLPINMAATSSNSDFSAVTPPGIVPTNVLDALLVPKDSTRTGWRNYDQSNGPYDREIDIVVPATASATEDFFKASLGDNAWKTLSVRSISNGLEILALHPGSDGHYWEIGVTILIKSSDIPSLGLATPTLGQDGNSTPVALRLLQYEPA